MKVNKSVGTGEIVKHVKPMPLKRSERFRITKKDAKGKTTTEIFNMMMEQSKGK
ncbi:MAG: hypothetical protein KR126chlam5_01571 [Candidatus Anoxychlamydiales bacterium]|nr:hypothetical protein [Candidatus Anoxychlamydiales bacterium]